MKQTFTRASSYVYISILYLVCIHICILVVVYIYIYSKLSYFFFSLLFNIRWLSLRLYSSIQYIMLCCKKISYITSYVLSTCISFGENGAPAWWDVSRDSGPSGNPNRKGLLFRGITWFLRPLILWHIELLICWSFKTGSNTRDFNSKCLHIKSTSMPFFLHIYLKLHFSKTSFYPIFLHPQGLLVPCQKPCHLGLTFRWYGWVFSTQLWGDFRRWQNSSRLSGVFLVFFGSSFHLSKRVVPIVFVRRLFFFVCPFIYLTILYIHILFAVTCSYIYTYIHISLHISYTFICIRMEMLLTSSFLFTSLAHLRPKRCFSPDFEEIEEV